MERQNLQETLASSASFINFLDRFETTNILIAADHLNQHGPLSTARHAYVVRLNNEAAQWEFINPGESLDLESKEEWKAILSIMADVASARFYEIIGAGTDDLEEATIILK